MPKTIYISVDQYIESFDKEIKSKLIQVREIIKQAIPKATETISYNIPCYKLGKFPLIYFSAYKNHLSISMPPATWAEKFAKELKDYKTSISTIQIAYSQTMPKNLIQKLSKYRLQESSKTK